MIAVLLSAVFAAATAQAQPAPTPVTPLRVEAPHERAVIETQYAARPAGTSISAVEADRIYALYLGRIGHDAPTGPDSRDVAPAGSGSPTP